MYVKSKIITGSYKNDVWIKQKHKIASLITMRKKKTFENTDDIKTVSINLISYEDFQFLLVSSLNWKYSLGYVTRRARPDGMLKKRVTKGTNKSALKDS